MKRNGESLPILWIKNTLDMTQLQETGGIVEELNQEKVTVNVESLKRMERKRTYAEVLSNIVTNTVVNEFKAEKSDKDNIM